MEEVLIQYGAIGVCLVYFMFDKIKFQAALQKTVENNTVAMTKVYEVMNNCKKNK
jgi:hypothetical protein